MRMSTHLRLCERAMDSAQWSAYVVGRSRAERDRCLNVARVMKGEVIRKLYINFARTFHREYLRSLRNLPVTP